jgi:hypothetical protein
MNPVSATIMASFWHWTLFLIWPSKECPFALTKMTMKRRKESKEKKKERELPATKNVLLKFKHKYIPFPLYNSLQPYLFRDYVVHPLTARAWFCSIPWICYTNWCAAGCYHLGQAWGNSGPWAKS